MATAMDDRRQALTCLLVADQFWHAFKMLHANEKLFQDELIEAMEDVDSLEEAADRVQSSGINATGIAAIVNIAFATELYLKAYHVATGTGWQRGHNTRKLFDELSDQARRQLFQSLSENGTGNTEPNVLVRLSHNSDAFEKFRYFHEIPEASYMIGFAQNLATSLQSLLKPFRDEQANALRDYLAD
jgi:hypothetical protein